MYPPAPRTNLIETLHGIAVADPFRGLENSDDPGTVAWVEAENALTRQLLEGPERERLVERLRELHRHGRSSLPAVRGSKVFFTHNDGTRNQVVLLVMTARTELPMSQPRRGGACLAPFQEILVDPNMIDPGGTTAITAFEPDTGGTRVVYALSRGGSDVQELLVHDLAARCDLPDRLRWVKFGSIAWIDGGFFYTRYPEPGTVPPGDEQYFCQVWFHRLGDAQSADRFVYSRPDVREVVFEVDVTSDGRHLVIVSRLGASDKAEVHVLPISDLAPFSHVGSSHVGFSHVGSGFSRIESVSAKLLPLISGFTDGWHFIDGEAGHLYFVTDAEAPLGRIVRLDVNSPQAPPHVIVPESTSRIQAAIVSRNRLVVHALRSASSRLSVFAVDGRPVRDIPLPGIASIVGLAGGWHDELCCATVTSYTMPPQVFACDVDAGRLAPLESPNVPIDSGAYVTEQVSYPSKDGTEVSMFLVRRTDGGGSSVHQRPAPILLTGYGGFDISLTPAFDPSDFVWLDRGGILAVAHLRGGGEYGESWHLGGMRERKQNVFDDFIAAAEWLIATGRGSRGAIAIEGGSNGGLLVGAAMVQRPDLFGAVVCRVPVADMLRYHLFTVGRFWIPEYGSADDPQQFAYLYRYSPYHNVVDGVAYPPTLIMTADTDDRVAPGMAKKFAARLQEATAPEGGPILLRVETRAGHGAGKPVSKQIDEQADVYAFLFTYLTRTSRSEHERR